MVRDVKEIACCPSGCQSAACERSVVGNAVLIAYAEMPAPDRTALARELLAGTNARVVTWAEWDARREAAIQEGRDIYRDDGG